MLTAILYLFLAPPPQTTLPTYETVLMPPAFLRMLIELDSSHILLYFITKRIFSRHFEKLFQLPSASVSPDDFWFYMQCAARGIIQRKSPTRMIYVNSYGNHNPCPRRRKHEYVKETGKKGCVARCVKIIHRVSIFPLIIKKRKR